MLILIQPQGNSFGLSCFSFQTQETSAGLAEGAQWQDVSHPALPLASFLSTGLQGLVQGNYL